MLQHITRRASIIAASLAAITLPAATASADLLTYDGFGGYPDGSVHELNGGFGWHEDWDTQNADDPYVVASGAPLSAGTLATTPGGEHLSGGDAFTNVGRRIDTAFGNPWHVANRVSDPFTAGVIDTGTVWVSLLIRSDESTSKQVRAAFHGSNIAWLGDPGIFVGTFGTSEWGAKLNDDGTFQSSGEAVVLDQTALLVGRFDFIGEGTSSFRLWVNPDASTFGGADLADGTADVTFSGLDATSIDFKSISFYVDNQPNQGSFDEIRLGTDYASVTPVPEPGALALAGLAGAGLLLRRRRLHVG